MRRVIKHLIREKKEKVHYKIGDWELKETWMKHKMILHKQDRVVSISSYHVELEGGGG